MGERNWVAVFLGLSGIQFFMGLNNVLSTEAALYIAGGIMAFGFAMKSEVK